MSMDAKRSRNPGFALLSDWGAVSQRLSHLFNAKPQGIAYKNSPLCDWKSSLGSWQGETLVVRKREKKKTQNFVGFDPATGGSFRRSTATGGESERWGKLLQRRVAVYINLEPGARRSWRLLGTAQGELPQPFRSPWRFFQRQRTDLAGDPTSLEEIVESDSERGDIWLHAVDVAVYLLVMASRGEMSLGVRTRVSSRPQHPRVLCFLLHHQWIMECSCRV
ncbi:hypothetical protein Taro_033575 [Colocasia esculenta]|uniref:Uncharacterized protein n=1 Tax=Colocasia esculenta TaxID=4460 RepID=A0A843W9E3_COLES|nr:hypothetical protein [Colocasia esculenta]